MRRKWHTVHGAFPPRRTSAHVRAFAPRQIAVLDKYDHDRGRRRRHAVDAAGHEDQVGSTTGYDGHGERPEVGALHAARCSAWERPSLSSTRRAPAPCCERSGWRSATSYEVRSWVRWRQAGRTCGVAERDLPGHQPIGPSRHARTPARGRRPCGDYRAVNAGGRHGRRRARGRRRAAGASGWPGAPIDARAAAAAGRSDVDGVRAHTQTGNYVGRTRRSLRPWRRRLSGSWLGRTTSHRRRGAT